MTSPRMLLLHLASVPAPRGRRCAEGHGDATTALSATTARGGNNQKKPWLVPHLVRLRPDTARPDPPGVEAACTQGQGALVWWAHGGGKSSVRAAGTPS